MANGSHLKALRKCKCNDETMDRHLLYHIKPVLSIEAKSSSLRSSSFVFLLFETNRRKSIANSIFTHISMTSCYTTNKDARPLAILAITVIWPRSILSVSKT